MLRAAMMGEFEEEYQTKPKTLSAAEKDRRIEAAMYEVFGVGAPPAGV